MVNYNCHAKNTRQASGVPFSPLSGFHPSQVQAVGGLPYTPGQGGPIVCSCQKKYFVGKDNTASMGLVCLDTSCSKDRIEAQYYPNHHYFYPQRSADISDLDHLPRWETVLDSTLLNPVEPPTPYKVHDNVHSTSRSHTSRPTQWDPNSGQVRADVHPLSSSSTTFTPITPSAYEYPTTDPPASHTSAAASVPYAKRLERLHAKYWTSPAGSYIAPRQSHYDVIIIGGGHNGLVTAAYLAKAGLKPLVLERRPLLGGAAVTEEIVPGYKFSRASYLAGLFRPHIIAELGLEAAGFKYLPRDPSSFTPTRLDSPHAGKYLLLGSDAAQTAASLAQFSARDAENYFQYEAFLSQARDWLKPLLDAPLPGLGQDGGPGWAERRRGKGAGLRQARLAYQSVKELGYQTVRSKDQLAAFYELLTGPATQILDRWFDHDLVKATLATDAVVGALVSPRTVGSAYVLLHHVMGEAAGQPGVWAYVQGGMGAISDSIAHVARQHGAELVTNATVREILLHDHNKRDSHSSKTSFARDGNNSDNYSSPRAVRGVRMEDGSEVTADHVVSAVSPYHTFSELMARPETQASLPRPFLSHVESADFQCASFKINLAVDRLPQFVGTPTCSPLSQGLGEKKDTVQPWHRTTIHLTNSMEEIERAYQEARCGLPATRPVIEMTIPSALDPTLAPPGHHVVQLFVQFAPYDVDSRVGSWKDARFRDKFVQRCLAIVEEFSPGFRQSIVGVDALSPLDLEYVFGLPRGNFHHGALSLHQLGYARPVPGYAHYRSPVPGLYMASAGTHPGGGVQGAAGYNCAQMLLSDLGHW